MNNPKEKAEELVNKFSVILIMSDTDAGQEILCSAIAKECALIAVDEIIKHDPTLPIEGEWDNYADDIKLSAIYWQEVKQEIEKL